MIDEMSSEKIENTEEIEKVVEEIEEINNENSENSENNENLEQDQNNEEKIEIDEIDEMASLNDKHLRLLAEYDNFRKRSIKEKDSAYSDGIKRSVVSLLSVYDNLERALAQKTEDEAYKKGVELTMKQFQDSLESLNVKIIDSEIGTTFNPDFHNAVMHIEDENLGENVIAEVFAKGFLIGDKVIRHTMVKSAN